MATHKSGSRYDGTYIAPLYLYPEEGTLDPTIRLNFDPNLYARIREAAGLTGPLVAPDGSDAFRRATGDARPDEVKVFDYIYGVLHCPAYRQTYAEFLKIDFPRVPFPASPAVFARVSAQGEVLRRLHLMDDAAIGETPYPFHGEGAEGLDCVVAKPEFVLIDGPTPNPSRKREGSETCRTEGEVSRSGVGRVWINPTQYFDNVPAAAWEFPIGGYTPAQKWLKDRKGRTLTFDDIRHYQKIIKILSETGRVMGEIDLPLD